MILRIIMLPLSQIDIDQFVQSNAIFGRIYTNSRLRVTHVMAQDLNVSLGITIDYSIPHKVVFIMIDYLEDMIVEANKDLKNSRLYYPGNDLLMKVDYNSPSLPTKDAEFFHPHIVRLLFASNRARPDTGLCFIFMYKGKSTDRTRLQETWKSC